MSHPEIHEIYEGVPTIKGALIEQPDGGLAYGAQQQPMVQPQQQQPVYSAQPPPYAQYAVPAAYGQPLGNNATYPPTYPQQQQQWGR